MGSQQPNVLVTAVGAVIGYGVVRCLRDSGRAGKIVGTDIYPDAVGQRWCDYFSQAVPAREPAYFDYLLDLIGKHAIKLVIPGTEYEIEALHRNRDRLGETDAVFLLNKSDVIERTHDKWIAYGEFVRGEIPTIPSRIEGNFSAVAEELGVPMLCKLRRSDAGKGMQLVESEADYESCRERAGDNFMVQRIVGNDEEEYTASVFGFGDGTSIHGPIFRRKLSKAGATDKAWTFEDPTLTSLIDSLTGLIQPVGPANYQFRRHEGQFLVLEVNPRISSATSIRAAFGFNEAAMCVDWFVNGIRPEAPVLRRGSALRYIADEVAFDDP